MYTENTFRGTSADSEDPDEMPQNVAFHQGLYSLLRKTQSSGTEINDYLEITTCDALKYIMGNPILIVFLCMGHSIRVHRVKHK